MISSRVFITVVVVCLAFFAISEGSLGVELHCRCIKTESKPIGRQIHKMMVISPNSHCEDTEIIAILKIGDKICLDPKAPWVKKLIQSPTIKPEQVTRDVSHLNA